MSEQDEVFTELPSAMSAEEHWREHEAIRRQRLREAAARPPGENLARALELSDYLVSIAGAARRT